MMQFPWGAQIWHEFLEINWFRSSWSLFADVLFMPMPIRPMQNIWKMEVNPFMEPLVLPLQSQCLPQRRMEVNFPLVP